MTLGNHHWRRAGRSIAAAWVSLRLALRRLADQESAAMDEHMDALQSRAAVASQAGDLPTLVRDQIDLLPGSRQRLRAHLRVSMMIVGDLVADWRAIWRDLWRN